MSTLIPQAIDFLKSFAEQTVRGLHFLGAMLGITYNTEADVTADLDALNKANSESQTAKAALKAAQAALDAKSEEAAVFITVVRDVLKPKLGNRYSVAWDQVGFFNRTLAVPRPVAKRQGLLKSIELYLTANPAAEIVDVATHTMAADLYQALSACVDTVAKAQSDQRSKTAARDAASAALDKRLRSLRRELKETLSDNDPRWVEFGFNIPADRSVPAMPEGLTAIAGAVGTAMLSWAHSIGAARYRVFAQKVGVDADFVYVATVGDLSKVIAGLPSGAHVKFRVTAANEAGESLPSEPVELVVP